MISTIIFFAIVIYGAFVAYKFISASMTKSQIKSEIVNGIGSYRGPEFSIEKGEEIARRVMVEHNIIPPDEETENEENHGENSSDSPGAATDPNTPKRNKVIINIKTDEKKTKIIFFIQYEMVIDLILFKNKQTYIINDEITNFS